jgi:dihydroorotase
MAHNPAILYGLKDRGFIREGYWGDVILVDLNAPYEVNKSNLLYKCGWSPLEGTRLKSQVVQSFVNGHRVYCNGEFDEQFKGKALWRQS